MVCARLEKDHFQVNGKSAESAVQKGKEAGICIGLHLNLSEGIPISEPSQIPSLLREENGVVQFLGKEGFIQSVTEGRIFLFHFVLHVSCLISPRQERKSRVNYLDPPEEPDKHQM